MNIVTVILLGIAFIIASVVALYLTYQVFAVYFTSHLIGMIAAGLLLVFGGMAAARGMAG